MMHDSALIGEDLPDAWSVLGFKAQMSEERWKN